MKQFLIAIYLCFFLCPASHAQDVISAFDKPGIVILNEQLRRTYEKFEELDSAISTYSTATVSFAEIKPAEDDAVLIGNGNTFESKTLPNCPSGKLTYTQATNAFSCDTSDIGSWEYVNGGTFTDATNFTVTATVANGYVYHLLVTGQSYSSELSDSSGDMTITMNNAAVKSSTGLWMNYSNPGVVPGAASSGGVIPAWTILGTNYQTGKIGRARFLIDFKLSYEDGNTWFNGEVLYLWNRTGSTSEMLRTYLMGFKDSNAPAQMTTMKFTHARAVARLTGRWFVYRTKQ